MTGRARYYKLIESTIKMYIFLCIKAGELDATNVRWNVLILLNFFLKLTLTLHGVYSCKKYDIRTIFLLITLHFAHYDYTSLVVIYSIILVDQFCKELSLVRSSKNKKKWHNIM